MNLFLNINIFVSIAQEVQEMREFIQMKSPIHANIARENSFGFFEES